MECNNGNIYAESSKISPGKNSHYVETALSTSFYFDLYFIKFCNFVVNLALEF